MSKDGEDQRFDPVVTRDNPAGRCEKCNGAEHAVKGEGGQPDACSPGNTLTPGRWSADGKDNKACRTKTFGMVTSYRAAGVEIRHHRSDAYVGNPVQAIASYQQITAAA